MSRTRDRARRRAAAALAAASLGLVASCSGSAPAGLTGTVVDPPFAVESAELTTVDGEAVDFGAEQDNRLSLLFFGYTSCPDVCSAVMATVASALTRLEPDVREQVEVYFLTTDPQTDTPEVLTDYLSDFDPGFTGVRADLEQTASLGRSVGIFVDEGSEGVAADPDAHGTYVVGVDESGEAPIVWRSDTSASQLAADITALVD